ncbi:MAG: hypothetical protein K0R39_1434 [Symbiobacteriaceae bacterium]|jgi:hypothetical protein|nr:hypothetical protein [Symbiobacteriaceae bacterium]
MLRKTLLASALVLTLAVTACTTKPAINTPIDVPKSPEPAPVTAPNSTAPATPAAPSDKSQVSSEITVPDEPWISAPAAVTALTRQVKITFSGPVDKASVEAQLAKNSTQSPSGTPQWTGDREVLLTFTSGCANYKFSAAGAKDAQGKELDPTRNPVLDLHMPCHGDGSVVVTLPGKQYVEIPIGTVIHDTDPASGWLLARNGNIFFLLSLDAKTKKPVARTETSLWGTFLPDGQILLGDGNNLRVVSQHGEVRRTIPLTNRPVNGAIAPDGKSAVVLLEVGAIRLDLTTWEAKAINDKASFERFARLNWGKETLLIVSDQDKAPFTINLNTGDINFPTGVPQIYSPNGQVVVDAEAGAIVGVKGERIFTLTAAMEARKKPYAIWAPDNKHVIFPGGQVIDITTGEQVAYFTNEFPDCKPIPEQLSLAGGQLIAQYLVPCH